VPPPKIKPLTARVVAPVPPLTTLKVEEEVRGDVPPPMMMSPEARVVAPVPPFTTEMVEVEVTAPDPPETKSSPEVRPVVMREPLIRRFPSKVELALTKIPLLEEVGVRAVSKMVSHDPGDPSPASEPQVTFPEESVTKAVQTPKV
jgi:hypothetical protein